MLMLHVFYVSCSLKFHVSCFMFYAFHVPSLCFMFPHASTAGGGYAPHINSSVLSRLSKNFNSLVPVFAAVGSSYASASVTAALLTTICGRPYVRHKRGYGAIPT
jgi:hypothetical protein